jgi:hypothetical protein
MKLRKDQIRGDIVLHLTESEYLIVLASLVA